jgi:predicted phosphoadenosine phosphosulfate sulfurtransferase
MRKKVKEYIKKWTTTVYLNDLPDEAPRRLEELHKVPSYRQICIAILKNDKHLKTLGQSQPVSKVYSQLKRKELEERGVIPKQWRLEI